MVRVMIVCDTPADLIKAYKCVNGLKTIAVVKVKNNLDKPIHNVNMNLTFLGKIVAECQMRSGKKPCFYHSNHFLYEIARADNPTQVQ